jgi:protocatechuate 3,4-dioxygenase beta subunit
MKTKNEKSDARLLDRREALGALGAFAPLLLVGCSSSPGASGDGSGDGSASDSAAKAGEDAGATASDGAAAVDAAANGDSAAASSDGGECVEIPDETGGPYPDVDGMIANTTYQRVDITEGLTGTPLSLSMQVLDLSNGCAPIVGARVIIWHCDANGVYSEYASTMNSDPAQNDVGSTTTTYLRGWQETDGTGTVRFTTIFPGWYTPRVTHIHVMVYDPSNLTTPVKTTQFTFADAVITTVYGQATLYPKGQNSTTVATDMVFGGNDENLVAAVTGSTSAGYVASIPIGLTSY